VTVGFAEKTFILVLSSESGPSVESRCDRETELTFSRGRRYLEFPLSYAIGLLNIVQPLAYRTYFLLLLRDVDVGLRRIACAE
jgi:hypothetical protein